MVLEKKSEMWNVFVQLLNDKEVHKPKLELHMLLCTNHCGLIQLAQHICYKPQGRTHHKRHLVQGSFH